MDSFPLGWDDDDDGTCVCCRLEPVDTEPHPEIGLPEPFGEPLCLSCWCFCGGEPCSPYAREEAVAR